MMPDGCSKLINEHMISALRMLFNVYNPPVFLHFLIFPNLVPRVRMYICCMMLKLNQLTLFDCGGPFSKRAQRNSETTLESTPTLDSGYPSNLMFLAIYLTINW